MSVAIGSDSRVSVTLGGYLVDRLEGLRKVCTKGGLTWPSVVVRFLLPIRLGPGHRNRTETEPETNTAIFHDTATVMYGVLLIL